jgi:hypothetical protein
LGNYPRTQSKLYSTAETTPALKAQSFENVRCSFRNYS